MVSVNHHHVINVSKKRKKKNIWKGSISKTEHFMWSWLPNNQQNRIIDHHQLVRSVRTIFFWIVFIITFFFSLSFVFSQVLLSMIDLSLYIYITQENTKFKDWIVRTLSIISNWYSFQSLIFLQMNKRFTTMEFCLITMITPCKSIRSYLKRLWLWHASTLRNTSHSMVPTTNTQYKLDLNLNLDLFWIWIDINHLFLIVISHRANEKTNRRRIQR
jgi:hypothetical protein